MAQQPQKSKSVVRAAKTAASKDSKERAKSATTTLDSFVNFAHNLGMGADNALSSSTYGFNPITRNRTMLEWIHRGSWLGGVAVDVVADDMTRAGIEFKGKIDPQTSAHLEEQAVGLGVWNVLNDTIKWSRLYGGAVAVMLIDGQDPETPFRLQTVRKGQFRGLLSLDRWMVEPSLNDLVTEYGPHLGQPKFYRVTAQAPALSGKRIHHTRCIRLEGIRLPYWQRLVENLWGLSVLERLYDRMIAFDSASTGAAQLVYKSYLRTYKIKDMREVIATGGDAVVGLTAYVDMMRRFQGIEGITLLDAEDDFSADSHSAFGGLSEALQQFGQQLSGALQIPLVRLFGQSPAGFSTGETDLRNYYDTIKQQQTKELKVPVTTVYRAMAASEGIALPDGFGIEFRSLWQLSETDKSNIATNVGNVVSTVEQSGLIDRATALKELRQSSQVTGTFTNITDEMITEAENEGPPIPEDVEIAEIKAGASPDGDEKDSKLNPTMKDTRRAKDGMRAAGILFNLSGTDKILMLCRGPNGDHPGTWSIPAGRVEPGESDEQAARRETLEETGFNYTGPLRVVHCANGFTTYEAVVDAPFVISLDPESTDYLWTTPSDWPNLHPGFKKMLEAS